MSSAALDFTQPAASVLLAQANFDNGQEITPDQVIFSQAATLPSTDASGLNAICLMSAAPGATAVRGQMYLRYNRTDISTVPGSRETSFAIGTATKVSDLLSQINSAWSLNLTKQDIVDAALPTVASGESSTVTLQIASRSLLWTGSVSITVTN